MDAMKIAEIRRRISGISVEAKIVYISESRRVRRRYGSHSVADATLEGETRSINLSLWEERIDVVNMGDQVKVSGAYVTEFRDQLQLNLPQSGKLTININDFKEYGIFQIEQLKGKADRLMTELVKKPDVLDVLINAIKNINATKR